MQTTLLLPALTQVDFRADAYGLHIGKAQLLQVLVLQPQQCFAVDPLFPEVVGNVLDLAALEAALQKVAGLIDRPFLDGAR